MSDRVMNETQPPRRIGRSIGAVLAGMLAGIILTIGTDIVLHVIGVFPPWGQSMVGFVGLVVSMVGAVVTWNKGPAFGPHWYPLALVVLAMPQAWAGGKLRVMQLRPRADA